MDAVPTLNADNAREVQQALNEKGLIPALLIGSFDLERAIETEVL
jgi:hypothetical protein